MQTTKFINYIVKKSELRNVSAFPYIYVITLFLSILEIVTYRGFVREYLFIGLPFFVWMLFISGFLLLLYYKDAGTHNINSTLKFVFIANKLFIVPLLLVYYFLLGLEARHYVNFVYSSYHVQISSFLPVIGVCLYVLAASVVIESKYIGFLRYRFPKITLGWVLTLIFLGLFTFFEFKDINTLVNDSITPVRQSLYFLKFDKEARRRHQFGYLYSYANFIKANTPPNSEILIPPQEYPWPMTGNILYFRYFLYPRRLVNGGLFDYGPDFSDNVSFILLAKGEFKIKDGNDYGWPKFDVKAKKVVYITKFEDDGTVKTSQVVGGFDHLDSSYSKEWGLIFLK